MMCSTCAIKLELPLFLELILLGCQSLWWIIGLMQRLEVNMQTCWGKRHWCGYFCICLRLGWKTLVIIQSSLYLSLSAALGLPGHCNTADVGTLSFSMHKTNFNCVSTLMPQFLLWGLQTLHQTLYSLLVYTRTTLSLKLKNRKKSKAVFNTSAEMYVTALPVYFLSTCSSLQMLFSQTQCDFRLNITKNKDKCLY